MQYARDDRHFVASFDRQFDTTVFEFFDFLVGVPGIFLDPLSCVGVNVNSKVLGLGANEHVHDRANELFQVQIFGDFEPLVEDGRFFEAVEFERSCPLGRVFDFHRTRDNVEARLVQIIVYGSINRFRDGLPTLW